MDKISTENLFLLEFLVDKVNLRPNSLPAEIAAAPGEICVSFRFLDNKPLDICESDFSPKCNSQTGTNSKSGKSCLFSLTPAQMRVVYNELNVYLTVFKRPTPNMTPISSVLIGEAVVSITKLLQQLLELVKSQTSQAPSTRSLQQDALITNTKNQVVGETSLFIRMTWFGKLIVTLFQMNLDDKSVLFKDKDGNALYRYKKLNAASKTGDVRVTPPTVNEAWHVNCSTKGFVNCARSKSHLKACPNAPGAMGAAGMVSCGSSGCSQQQSSTHYCNPCRPYDLQGIGDTTQLAIGPHPPSPKNRFNCAGSNASPPKCFMEKCVSLCSHCSQNFQNFTGKINFGGGGPFVTSAFPTMTYSVDPIGASSPTSPNNMSSGATPNTASQGAASSTSIVQDSFIKTSNFNVGSLPNVISSPGSTNVVDISSQPGNPVEADAKSLPGSDPNAAISINISSNSRNIGTNPSIISSGGKSTGSSNQSRVTFAACPGFESVRAAQGASNRTPYTGMPGNIAGVCSGSYSPQGAIPINPNTFSGKCFQGPMTPPNCNFGTGLNFSPSNASFNPGCMSPNSYCNYHYGSGSVTPRTSRSAQFGSCCVCGVPSTCDGVSVQTSNTRFYPENTYCGNLMGQGSPYNVNYDSNPMTSTCVGGNSANYGGGLFAPNGPDYTVPCSSRSRVGIPGMNNCQNMCPGSADYTIPCSSRSHMGIPDINNCYSMCPGSPDYAFPCSSRSRVGIPDSICDPNMCRGGFYSPAQDLNQNIPYQDPFYPCNNRIPMGVPGFCGNAYTSGLFNSGLAPDGNAPVGGDPGKSGGGPNMDPSQMCYCHGVPQRGPCPKTQDPTRKCMCFYSPLPPAPPPPPQPQQREENRAPPNQSVSPWICPSCLSAYYDKQAGDRSQPYGYRSCACSRVRETNVPVASPCCPCQQKHQQQQQYYKEVGAELGNNSLKIRVPKGHSLVQAPDNSYVDGDDIAQQTYQVEPTYACCKCCPCVAQQINAGTLVPVRTCSCPFIETTAPAPAATTTDPKAAAASDECPCETRSRPQPVGPRCRCTKLRLPYMEDSNIVLAPQKIHNKDGVEVAEVPTSDRDTYLLRFGKKGERNDPKSNLELELATPKGAVQKPPPKQESRDVQCDPVEEVSLQTPPLPPQEKPTLPDDIIVVKKKKRKTRPYSMGKKTKLARKMKTTPTQRVKLNTYTFLEPRKQGA